MNTVLILMSLQGLLGAFDTLWHHEIKERLPSKPSALGELTLHSVREFLYAVLFFGLAWWEWRGGWAFVLAGILLVEIVITLWDFVIEDRTRRLPRLERITHTVLAINFGAILAFLAPVMVGWANRPTGLEAVSHGIWSWVFTVYGIGVLVWAVRDLVAVTRLAHLQVPEWQRNPIRRADKASRKTYLITGATGLIGTALTRELIAAGDDVVVLSRDPAKARDKFGPHAEAVSDLATLPATRRIDGIVHLAGEPLAGGLWTRARKLAFFDSRLDVGRAVNALAARLEKTPAVLISASATGYYGDRGDAVLDETSGAGDGFLSSVCQATEHCAVDGERLGMRVCRLRFGIVLGRGGGMLPALALPARFGLGAWFGSGRQWMPWIHLEDTVRLIRFALRDPRASSVINAVAPNPVRQRELVRALGRSLGRPALLSIPAVLLRRLPGGMHELFLTSGRVLPQRAQDLGFRFHYTEIGAALADLTRHPRPSDAEAVYFNAACPVCRTEIEHYQKRTDACAVPLAYHDINTAPDALAAFGLGRDDIKRRMYVVDGAGELKGGVDAFEAIWRVTPGYRPLARLVGLPGMRALGAGLYDGIAVPLLAARNRRREARDARRGGESHGHAAE